MLGELLGKEASRRTRQRTDSNCGQEDYGNIRGLNVIEKAVGNNHRSEQYADTSNGSAGDRASLK